MAYKSYSEQVKEHINFLRTSGFNINSLIVDPTSKEIRCRPIGKVHGRGELSYRCTSRQLDNGLLGLGTWCRGRSGEEKCFQTYGLWTSTKDREIQVASSNKDYILDSQSYSDLKARRAYGFWMHSLLTGKSDYLKKKEVGYYGVRFRTGKYGNVGIIPMYDSSGRLMSYQILNPDGSKRFADGTRTLGLQYKLRPLVDSECIGVSESYVTAATCMELTDIPTVCAFSSENLIHVSKSIRKQYPNSHIYIFSDNDRHLSQNIGVRKALEAGEVLNERVSIITPEFGGTPPSKSASDWNDLVRIIGFTEAKNQIYALKEGFK